MKICSYVATKIIGLDYLALLIPQHILRLLFPISSNEVFVPEIRGNPSYFDALPISVLQERLMANNSHAAILEKYQRRILELTSKGGSLKLSKRHMVGLESYDINNSPKYASKFGFRSEHLARARPSDWIIAKRSVDFSRRGSSVNAETRKRRAGATSALNAFVRIDMNAHAKQVDALYEYCSPVLNSSGVMVRASYRFFENDGFVRKINELNEIHGAADAVDHSEGLSEVVADSSNDIKHTHPPHSLAPQQESASVCDLHMEDSFNKADSFLDV